MKIAIIGYGKMGKAVEQEAKRLSISVSKIIDTFSELKNASFSKDEVAIEFTEPDACVENLKILIEKGASVVCGTTSWYDKKPEIENLVKKYNTGLLYAENFSIGVQTFYKILEYAAKRFNKLSYYDAMLYEAHHKNKKDAPSGTARRAGEIVCEGIARKTKIVTGNINRALAPEEIHISSARCGNIIGEHRAIFDSEYDSIEINHISKGREGYSLGAIKCAEWLCGKKGVFSIEDYMESLDEKF